jgi:aromatic ring-opening dioxygenase LigB subunit
MVDGRYESSGTWPRDEPRVVIEVSGANVVIRPSTDVDRNYTMSLADVIDAASATDTCVVIDPEPIRCDDSFAAYEAYEPTVADRTSAQPRTCRAFGAEVVLAGVVRLHAEGTVWLIDVSKARFCQLDAHVDLRFLGDDAWKPIVAVCVTPSRLIALGVDGTRTSARRAHPVPLG